MACIGICTEVGTTHEANQDGCCVKVASTPVGEILMAVVCDGVGGLSMGELASSTTIVAFDRWFERDLPPLVMTEGFALIDVRESWEKLLQQLDRMIRTFGHDEAESLGTTVTAMLCANGRYLIAHVGDCRVYEIRHDAATQLTEDQTFVAREVARGAMTPEEARNHPRENVILQAVGAGRGIVPAYYEGMFDHGAVYVMATDGAYRRPGTAAVSDLFSRVGALSDQGLQDACSELVSRAMSLGETDNLTCLAFSLLGEGR